MEDLTKHDLLELLDWADGADSCDSYLYERIRTRIAEMEELEDFASDCGDACKL